ncbi:universal stress protein [Streptomyces sp. NPDC059499]|uniref:universal stress protein n=1 Tax=Streptomyces sp. NPDC059499 TaxID=3346852 RepID=UPI0036755869
MASRPVVVGVDGSESSLLAADWAADEALRHGVPLRLVYASLWLRYEGAALASSLSRSDDQVMAENVVGSTAERVRGRAPSLRVTTEVLPEEAVGALLREGQNAFALVTGSRGRGEIVESLLGSVSLAVAARAHCPVVVVRGDKAGLEGVHGRIALGVGDTDVDSAAVRFAFAEAQLRDCGLDVVRAWRCPSHETTIEPADHYEAQASSLLDEALATAVRNYPDVAVRRVTAEGPARKVLLKHSAVADLLIVGARRRQNQFGMQLGRVAHTVLHHAACPVGVVPRGAESAPEEATP